MTINITPQHVDSTQRDWNAVYTQHQHERSVAASLVNNGFEVFLPTYRSVRQWSDRRKNLSVPLFPCYVFLRGSSERRLKVLTTPGVHFFVSFSGEPAPIPNSEIRAIRKAVESGSGVEVHPLLTRGDWVRVKSGPLMDVEGIFMRRKSSYRLVLSCALVGKSVSVEIDAFNVTRIGRSSTSLKQRAIANESLARRVV